MDRSDRRCPDRATGTHGSPRTTWQGRNLAALVLLSLLLPGRAVGAASDVAVVVDGERRTAESARFGISVHFETWDDAAKQWRRGIEHAEVRYWLEVVVDERSGEDGAAAPSINAIPAARANGGTPPSLAALATLVVEERDDGEDCEAWDAWFGNDAPGLCRNVVRFQGWDGFRLKLRWDSEYVDYDAAKPLRVEGAFEFVGIHLRVPADVNPDEWLERVWSGQTVDAFDRHTLLPSDNGENWPAGWRHMASYLYLTKGAPAQSYWRIPESAPAQAE